MGVDTCVLQQLQQIGEAFGGIWNFRCNYLRITSYNVCYTKLLRLHAVNNIEEPLIIGLYQIARPKPPVLNCRGGQFRVAVISSYNFV